MANPPEKSKLIQPLDSNSGEIVWTELIGRDILLHVVKRGEGTATAPVGTIVKCHMNGYINGPDGLRFIEELENECYKIGDGDAFPALELTLRHSHVGDVFKVRTTSKFGFGPMGRPPVKQADKTTIPPIPPNSNLEYEVEVVEFVDFKKRFDPTSPTYHRDIALCEVNLRKDSGNRWYSYTDYTKASRSYSKGVEIAQNYLQSMTSKASKGMNVDPDGLLIASLVACLNNLAACFLHKGENLKARDISAQVIELDPTNVKALLRAAKASLALHNFEETEACLKRILEIEPGNIMARREHIRLRSAMKDYKDQSSVMGKNMAKKMGKKAVTQESIVKSSVINLTPVVATPSSTSHTPREQTPQNPGDSMSATRARKSISSGRSNSISQRSASMDKSRSGSDVGAPSGNNGYGGPASGKSNGSDENDPDKNKKNSERRGWSGFLMMFTSVCVVVLTVGFGYFFSRMSARR